MLKTISVHNELIFDGWGLDFDHFFSGTKDFIAYEFLPGSARGPTSAKSALGLFPSMLMVVTKCPDPAIRHPLGLLQDSRKRARSWNTFVAFILARLVINAEQGSASTVSSSHRQAWQAELQVVLNTCCM